MKIPISWIKNYIDFNISNEDVSELLTMSGTEVSDIIKIGNDWDSNLIVGEIKNIKKHPNADRLSLVSIDTATDLIEVVCGAPNITPGQKIAFARPGANIYNPRDKKMSILKKSSIRGVESEGMICSPLELKYSEEHEGILVLPKEAKNGQLLNDLLSDDIFDLDITPNRADCLSVMGIVRELITIFSAQKIDHQILSHFDLEKEIIDIKNQIDFKIKINSTDCYRYSGISINSIKINDSPFWIKDKLIKSGLRPINNIVDITNFVMLEYGQPLHAFDLSKIKTKFIEVKKNNLEKEFIALDNVNRELNEKMLRITDGNKTIALAGVIGGDNSEIDSTTSNIFLEAACFDMSNIRQTSKELNLSTDASYRFERGVPYNFTIPSLLRAITLIKETNQTHVEITGLWDEQSKVVNETKKSVQFTSKRYKKIIGENISLEKAKNILKNLGLTNVQEKSIDDEFELKLNIPSWRQDLDLEDDLIEEIARIIGYDNLSSSPMQYAEKNIPIEKNVEYRNQTRLEMKAMGYIEVINYPVLNESQYINTKITNSSQNPIELINPINQDNKFMRSNLRSGLIDNLSKNSKKYPDIESWKFYELGKTYSSIINPDFKLPTQNYTLGMIANGLVAKQNWAHNPNKVNFYTFKGEIERLLTNLKINYNFTKNNDSKYYSKESATIISNQTIVGSFGFIRKETLLNLNAKIKNVLYAEFNLEKLFENITSTNKFQKISPYPQATRDLSFVVDKNIIADDIIKIINENPLISELNVIDVYENLENGKKSLTFRLSYQSFNETLSNKQIEESQNKTLKLLKKNLNVELRKQI